MKIEYAEILNTAGGTFTAVGEFTDGSYFIGSNTDYVIYILDADPITNDYIGFDNVWRNKHLIDVLGDDLYMPSIWYDIIEYCIDYNTSEVSSAKLNKILERI